MTGNSAQELVKSEAHEFFLGVKDIEERIGSSTRRLIVTMLNFRTGEARIQKTSV